MKSFNNLYDKISSFDNLHLAYLKARRNKRYKKEVLEFSSRLEENLIDLHNILMHQVYKPGRYKEFYVYDPKVRLILALPFRDRVIQQAICNIIEPLFERTFISDSFACRKNKGTLAGVVRNEKFISSELGKGKQVFCLKMDVRKYFYNIDHAVLKQQLRKVIRCKKTLGLLDIIINSTDDPGVPVGNLTSQLFANIYLSRLDHFIKEILCVKHYVRYMDDMVIVGNDKKILWAWHREIKGALNKLHLELNEKTAVFNISQGIDFLGFRQFARYRILRKRVMSKNYRKFRKFVKANVPNARFNDSLQSLLGQCKYCESKVFLEKIKTIIGEEKWEQIFLKNKKPVNIALSVT